MTARYYYEQDVPANPIEKHHKVVDARETRCMSVNVGKDVREKARERKMRELSEFMSNIDTKNFSQEAVKEMMLAASAGDIEKVK